MKSMFTSDSRFNPQGAQPVQLAGAPPQGWNAQLPAQQQPGAMPMQQAGAIPQVNGGGGMQVPQGAQPVALAGQSDPTVQRQPTLPPMQQQPQAQPFFGRQQQQQQQQQQPPQGQPQLGAPAPASEQVHVISVTALGADGREYLAEFDAVFPAGSRVLGVTERMG